MIDVDHDLEEIVQMDGVGLVTLRSAIKRMPERIGALGVLYRDLGKTPAFFDAAQIQALVDHYRPLLEAGNPPGHREADALDFIG
jgi:hypothetical protein